eukprot:GHVL01026247.1.p2 GENE.GHVL01026247.1~~GHVL01026247.1.p2  ORF type:complete len:295 (-),score=73.02 GHVL01026247.1:39-923(-)
MTDETPKVPAEVEEDYTGKTADQLTELGKSSGEDYKKAVARFAAALQSKLKEVSNEELHPALGLFYLNYGDAVLSFEENSTSLLHGQDDAEEDDDEEIVEKNEGAPAPAEDEEASLPQIAYENLAIAALILTTKLKAGALPGSKTPAATVEDILRTSFAYIRLGDLALMEKKFEDAVSAYQTAVDLRLKNDIEYSKIYNITFHIAHALEYQLKYEEALPFYEEAVSGLEKHLKGENCKEKIPNEKVKDFEENLKSWRSTLEICKEELEVKKKKDEEELKNPDAAKVSIYYIYNI